MNKFKKNIIPILLLLIGIPSIGQPAHAITDLLNKAKTAKDSSLVNTYIALSHIYHYQDMFDSALYYCNEALVVSRKIGYDFGEGRAYANTGVIYYEHGEYNKALEVYFKTIQLYQKVGASRDLAATLTNMANIYTEQDKYELSLKNLFQAAVYNLEVKDTMMMAAIYVNIGRNYIYSNRRPLAYKYFDSSLSICHMVMAGKHLSTVDSMRLVKIAQLTLLAESGAMMLDGRLDEALAKLQQAWEQVKENKGIREKNEILKQIADIYVREKKYPLALTYTGMVLKNLRQDSLPSEYMDIYETESQAYEGLGQYDKALIDHRLFKKFSDTLFSEEKLKISTEMQAKYESQQKDDRIAQFQKEQKAQRRTNLLYIIIVIIVLLVLLLTYRAKKFEKRVFVQKDILVRQEKELEKRELEKKLVSMEQMAIRAQMNPHFIFNSLHSIQQFIVGKDILTANKYLTAFSVLIRQSLDNSIHPLIPLEEEIRFLDSYLHLEQIRTDQAFHYSIAKIGAIDQQPIYIPNMILQPFVENCIRHGVISQPAGMGQIRILFEKAEQLVVVIEDNGEGWDISQNERIQSSSFHKSRGISLTMKRIGIINKIYESDIAVRIENLREGDLPESGTRVIIEFPPDLL